MSNLSDPKKSTGGQSRRADVHANVDAFHSNFPPQQNASPRGLSSRRVSGSGFLGSSTSDLPSPTLSSSSTAVDERYSLRLQRAHAANSRGQPFELSWRVPIDWILKLRAREPSSASKPLQDPGNAITSATMMLNGVPVALRLTRVLRATTKDAASNASPSQREPPKTFESHFVACHLVTVPGGAPHEDVVSPHAMEGLASAPGGEDVAKDVQLIERQSWERKVSFQAELPPVAPSLRATHPLLGAPEANGATIPRLRRVVEGVISGSVKVIGFSNFVPLRELLSYYIAMDDEASSSSRRQNNDRRQKEHVDPLVVFDLDFKLFVSHAWQECVSRHNLASSMSRQQYNLVGLKNHGSTCYINVLLQSLFHISFFRREVMALTGAGKRRSEAAIQLQKVFHDLERSDTAVDTLGLLKAIKVNPSIQNDSHEFLSEFFLHRVFKNITDVFSFKVKYLTTCHEVDYSSSSEETLFELSLCVGVKYPTLEAAIQKEFAREPIADLYDTGVYEFGKQKASRQMYMVTFPHILFVHSKRFDHYAKKVHASQSFPIRLEVAPSHDYLLHSIIVHHGTGVNSGHFTTFVRVSDAERGSGGLAGGQTQSSSFFHFDDEAVYPVPTEQVMEEMVGIHWTSPSSSAYILVYVEAEAFDEATTQFDPIPDDVAAMVKRMERTTSASQRQSPLPTSNVATPRAAPSSTTSSPTPSHLSPPMSHSNPRRRPSQQDPSDLQRIMSACCEMRGDTVPPPPTSSGDARRTQVTVWTIPGMRAAMHTLRTVHDLVDLRFAAKYFRQEAVLQPSCIVPQAANGGSDGSMYLWGTDRSALSLALSADTTLEAVRQQAMALFLDNCATGKHFNASGEAMLLEEPADPQHAPQLFLCVQRKNGTWRPSVPLFDVCNPATDASSLPVAATPERGELEAPAFANTMSTNISGSFTVRKRFEAQGLKVPTLRVCPPDPHRASQAVTIGDLLRHEVFAELSQGASEVLELHVVLACPTPIQHAFMSREAIVSPSTTSRFSATPGNPYSASLRHRQSPWRGNSITQFPAIQGGPSAGGDDQAQGSVSSLGAALSAPHSVVASRVPSTALPYSNMQGHVGTLLASVQSEDGFRVNPMAAALGDAAAAADTTVVDDDLSSEIYRGEQTSVTAAGVLRMSASCADSAMLYFKAFDGRQVSLMCAFYVPLDWNVLQVICTLFVHGYLDWSPYAARGLAAYHLSGMVQSPQSSWSAEECHVFSELRRTLYVFEEVRPERLDVVDEWLLSSLHAMELDHGDVLVVQCSRGSTISAGQEREDERAFSSSDDDEGDAGPLQSAHAPGARLARIMVESCRNVIVACTLLSPLWGILSIGDTVFVLLDLASVSVTVEELVLLKLQQRAHRADGSIIPDILLALPDDAGPHGEGGIRLPNALSPQAPAASTGGNHLVQKHQLSWWCGDCMSHAPRHHEDRDHPSALAKPLLHHRLRMLRLVPSTQLTDVACALRQAAPAAALQVGESTAPINLLTTLFPSVTTTLLNWGSLLFTGATPQERAAGLAAGGNDEGVAPVDPAIATEHPRTPERSTRLAMGDGTPPPLFDVSASMASQHSQLPWARAHAVLPHDDGRGTSASDQAQLHASPHHIAMLQAQSGMLRSHMSRLFVDIRVPHTCLPRRSGSLSPSLMAALPSKVDIVVTWYGWCRANPTHRFRLREVSMHASAFVVYALAAQFLGFLDGVRPSCSAVNAKGDTSLSALPQLSCQHMYPLMTQLAIAVIHHPPTSGEGSAGSASVSDTNHEKRHHGGGGGTMIGSIRHILPLSSLQLLHEAHAGCTAPPLRGDILVSDLLRILHLLPAPEEAIDKHNSSKAIELALLLMPNTPMDMEECLHHSSTNTDDSKRGSASARSSRCSRKDGKPAISGIHRSVEMKRNACMFVVNVVQANTHQSIAPPGLIPASDTIDELRLWLDQLYPARHHKATRHSRLLVEVFVPPQQEGMHANISAFASVDPCDYWLSRDVLEYSQRLSDSSKRSAGATSSSSTRHIVTSASPVTGSVGREEDVVPTVVNHRKQSTAFLDLYEEDPVEYQNLVQRSVMFHYHLMSKSKNGLNPSEGFDVKKVLLLFPARLLVVHD